jgi:hypothetical protein
MLALEFDQYGQEDFVVGPARKATGVGDPAHEGGGVALLGCPAVPLPKFRVGIGRVHHGEYTSQIKHG